MKGTEVINQDNKAILVSKLYIAQTFWPRLKGLLGTSELAAGNGLLIHPCSSIHTFGMKYPIDVIFLSSELEVLRVIDSISAMRAACCLGSAMALELPAGTAAKAHTLAGHHLTIK
jgi:uncharacterized membrane protein (UPF0127 family)